MEKNGVLALTYLLIHSFCYLTNFLYLNVEQKDNIFCQLKFGDSFCLRGPNNNKINNIDSSDIMALALK